MWTEYLARFTESTRTFNLAPMNGDVHSVSLQGG